MKSIQRIHLLFLYALYWIFPILQQPLNEYKEESRLFLYGFLVDEIVSFSIDVSESLFVNH